MTSETICSGAEATCEGSYSRADPAVINQTLSKEKAHKPKGEKLREKEGMAWEDKMGGY